MSYCERIPIHHQQSDQGEEKENIAYPLFPEERPIRAESSLRRGLLHSAEVEETYRPRGKFVKSALEIAYWTLSLILLVNFSY